MLIMLDSIIKLKPFSRNIFLLIRFGHFLILVYVRQVSHFFKQKLSFYELQSQILSDLWCFESV